MRKTAFLVMFLLMISSALAQNPLVEAFSQELQGQKLSGPLGTLFGNEEINFHLETDEGVIVVSIVTKDRVVKSIEEKELQKPSLNVYADEKTLLQIQRSEDPLLSLKKALDQRKIRYKAVGLLNKIKFSFLSVFSNIASLFISDDSGIDLPGEKEGFNPQPEPPGKVGPESPGEKEGFNPQPEPPGNVLTGEVVAEFEPEQDEHIVELTENGFEPYELKVKAGDTVTWKNVRKGSLNQGMIIGVRECRDVRSKVLEQGDSYSYTFEEAAKCTIADGIWTTKESRVNVE